VIKVFRSPKFSSLLWGGRLVCSRCFEF